MEKRNVWAIILILFCVAISGTCISLARMYRFSIDEETLRLGQMVRAQVSLIEAVARFDVQNSNQDADGGAFAATFSQVVDGLSHLKGFGHSGEFLLGKRIQDQIAFLYSDRQVELGLPAPVAYDRTRQAEPMRRALNGESGPIRLIW